MNKIFFGVLVILLALVLTPSLSNGGNYGYVTNHVQYGYNYAYQQHYDYQVNPVVVIGVPVSNLGVPFYWSVGQELREERVAERAAALVQGKTNKPEKTSGRPVAEVSKPSPGLTLDFDIIAGASTSLAPVQDSDIDNRVTAIFNESCVRCHKPGSSKPGNIQLFTNDGSLFKLNDWKAELQRRELVYDVVRGTEGVSSMPKNAEQLSDEKIEVIYSWLREQTQR